VLDWTVHYELALQEIAGHREWMGTNAVFGAIDPKPQPMGRPQKAQNAQKESGKSFCAFCAFCGLPKKLCRKDVCVRFRWAKPSGGNVHQLNLKEKTTKQFWWILSVLLLITSRPGVAPAQVPPAIEAELRRLGQAVFPGCTAKLYRPL